MKNVRYKLVVQVKGSYLTLKYTNWTLANEALVRYGTGKLYCSSTLVGEL